MKSKKFQYRKPARSLRTILMIWFLVLSMVPMMFVTGYSLVNFERAINNELAQRLRSGAREVLTTIAEYENYLGGRRNRHKADPMLAYYLLTNSIGQARNHIQTSVRASYLASLSLFNREGQMVVAFSGDENGNAKQNRELEEANLSLSDAYKSDLEKNGQITRIDVGAGNSMDLIAITRLEDKTGRLAGYVEEIINIGPLALEKLRQRMDLEIVLFDSKANIISGSHPDFFLYKKDYFAEAIASDPESFFDLTVRNEPFGFIALPVSWGDSKFMIGLGASKQKAKTVLRNVNYAFFVMIAAIGVLLVFTAIVATRVIVRPVNELVEAIHTMDVSEVPVEIPVSSDTEIGVLMESFNEMSLRIHQAKSELEKKIQELERAYAELKDTQARLVHSTKMASLGQLVAGVAHELNNPIGFIYSNMSHLRDYSQRLTKIIEAAENDPKSLAKAKTDNEFDYIVQDLPRLISSCEDGARRTRDIVLGLRNFSRLEEAKIKRVSLQEGIENTLRLLSGETKNRIEVHTEFEPIPEVLCYPSQLNQVFMNILTNAAQAIEGEGEIWVCLKHLNLEGEPARAQVSIRDSGKGMPTDTVDQIFDPFFTTKSVGQGTGLGLSISYGIIKKHGGDIQVHSELGKGTEFVITLPVDGPPGAENASAS